MPRDSTGTITNGCTRLDTSWGSKVLPRVKLRRGCAGKSKQGGRRSGADPFIIALAMVNNGTVVTEENATGNMTKPHIPDVCGDLGVTCLNLMEYIEEQGWTF